MMTTCHRRHRRAISLHGHRPLLLLLLSAFLIFQNELSSPLTSSLFFSFLADAAIPAAHHHDHELTDDASRTDDEEGFIGNIPLYLAYDIRHGELECLYENISTPHSYFTSSVYVLGTKDGYTGMRALIVMEGPVAPSGFTMGGVVTSSGGGNIKSMSSGTQFQYHLDSFTREGGIKDEKVVRSVAIVDFEQAGDEEGGEGYGEENIGHGKENGVLEDSMKREAELDEERRILNAQRNAAELNLEQLRQEAKLDDDFVKLQMDRDGGANHPPQPHHRDNANEGDAKDVGASDHGEGRRRRLMEDTIKLSAGLPFERTIEVTIPGWYRLCVGPPPSGEAISVEMELRSGTKLDPRTGHVLSEEDTETHSEIHSLYKEEASPEQRAAIASSIIKDEDLATTREQLRILERVYSEIIAKQLEERRTWNWRTIKNQKSYGHLVMGNFLETLAYMGITGWQVYTIRRWFGGGPTLGR